MITFFIKLYFINEKFVFYLKKKKIHIANNQSQNQTKIFGNSEMSKISFLKWIQNKSIFIS